MVMLIMFPIALGVILAHHHYEMRKIRKERRT